MTGLVDFARLVPPNRPSRWLIAPPGVTAVAPDAAAPVFEIGADALADRLAMVLSALPRTTPIARSGRRMAFVQVSRVFRFADDIAAEAFDIGDGRSSPALYSVSRIGYSDFGVNRTRLESVLAALAA
jgi:uncharacterized protein (DUF1499 family)